MGRGCPCAPRQRPRACTAAASPCARQPGRASPLRSGAQKPIGFVGRGVGQRSARCAPSFLPGQRLRALLRRPWPLVSGRDFWPVPCSSALASLPVVSRDARCSLSPCVPPIPAVDCAQLGERPPPGPFCQGPWITLTWAGSPQVRLLCMSGTLELDWGGWSRRVAVLACFALSGEGEAERGLASAGLRAQPPL